MRRIAHFGAWLIVLATMSVAQTTGSNDGVGFLPFGSFSEAEFDTINEGNLNIHFSIPVVQKAGRGVSISGKIVYDSLIWSAVGAPLDSSGNPVGNANWLPPTNIVGATATAWGWYFIPVAGYGTFTQTQTPPTCPNHSGIIIRSNYTYHDANGTGYYMGASQAVPADCNGVGHGFGPVMAQDGSGYSLSVDSAMNVSVTSPGGLLIHPSQVLAGSDGSAGTPGLPGLITDTNGNQVSVSNGSYTDTLGLTAVKFSSGTSGASITYPSPTNSTTFVGATINYTTRTVQTAFQCFLVNYGPRTANLVTSVVLADGSTYSFTYEPTPGAPGNTTARIASVTLPSGGTITYSYPNGAIDCSDGSNPKLTRTTPDGQWTYTRQITETAFSNGQPGVITGSITTVNDPLGNVSVINFGKGDKFESKRQIYTGSSTLLETIETCYNGDAFPCTSTAFNLPITQKVVRKELPDTTGKVAQTDTRLTSAGLVTDVYEYDFGQGAVGPLVRHTATTYNTFTANIFYDPNNPTVSYPVTIQDRPATVTVTDGSGNTQSQTSLFYDETTPAATSNTPQHVPVTGSRGNLTTVKKLVQGTTTIQKTTTYNDTGTIATDSDFQSPPNITTYGYGANSCGNSFPDSVTNPLWLEKTTVWGCNGAVATSITDQNNQPTLYTYGDPNFWRLTEIDYPDGGQTTTTYNLGTNRPWNIITTTKQTSTQSISHKTILDSLARVSQQQLTTDPEGVDLTDTTYDAAGHVLSVSNPYRTTSDSTYGLTTYTYDGLGRVKTQTQPDGSKIQTTYSANCTTVTDEAGRQRKSCSDGLGELVQVIEDPATGGLNYETDYQYNTLGDLICAVQKGTDTAAFTTCAAAPSTWRPRSFAYNSLSRLTQASNPESGTITYSYDLNGNVSSRVAPKPNPNSTGTVTTNYTYDALNRLTQKSYVNITTGAVKYAYDGGTLSCPGPSLPTITGARNLIGRRSGMCSGLSASAFSYDPMGRPIERRANKGSVAKTYSVNYTYYQDGSVKTLTYPSGDIVTYTVGGAGRVTQVSDSSNNYVGYSGSPATYSPNGALATMVNGHTSTFAGTVTSNVYNNRLQPVLLSTSVSSTPVFSLCYDFHLGVAISSPPCSFPSYTSGDNGNVFQVLDKVDSTRSTVFQYDPLNRLKQANTITTTGANCWGEVYTIDAWGNLTNRSGVSGMTGCFTEPLNTTASIKNQLGGISYDAAGNVTNDGNGNLPTYNAENRMITDAGVTYSYDADGVRMEKSNGTSGTMYWPSPSGEYLAETDLSGTINEEYIYFNGARIARVDRPSGTVHYYFSDHLGSASVITDASGTVQERYYYYPYGATQASIGSDPNHYKFTGKERDGESGFDNFGARYYTSNIGRFMTPDWAAKPISVPYANFGNPQSLNLYSYVENNPTTTGDPDGHADWYDTNGRRLGTDGVNDGGVVIQKASAVSYSSDHSLIDVSGSGIPVASFSQAEGNAIQASVDRTLAPAGGDRQGGFHEEGFTEDASGIHNAAPGPAYQSGDATAHINQTINSSTTMEEHTHPVGTQDTAGTTTFGGTHFDPTPSPQDLKGAAGHDNITHVEASAGNKTVYVYNDKGVQAKVPLSAFPKKRPLGSNGSVNPTGSDHNGSEI